MSTTDIKYTNGKGEVKHYATYHSAWRACIRLNETATNGTWLFEGDEIGWYLYFDKDGE
jgi:hypothetical protein